jgi:hypothetical protein
MLVVIGESPVGGGRPKQLYSGKTPGANLEMRLEMRRCQYQYLKETGA